MKATIECPKIKEKGKEQNNTNTIIQQTVVEKI